MRYMRAAWFERAPDDRRLPPDEDPEAPTPPSSYARVVPTWEPIRLGRVSDYETVTLEAWRRGVDKLTPMR